MQVITIDKESDYRNQVDQAADTLRCGGLVAIPTETVYGVAARADQPDAVTALRRLKGRPDDKPFTVHLGETEQVYGFVPEPSGLARRLIRKAWPGPITLILDVTHVDTEKTEVVSRFGPEVIPAVYYNGTVGLRCPDDSVARTLLSDVEFPVVAASANRAGATEATTADAVRAALDGQIDLILDHGRSRYGRASTVVRVGASEMEVIREGVIDRRMLDRMAQLRILFVCTGNTCRSPMAAALCSRVIADRLACAVDELGAHHVVIESAGASAGPGASASQGAISAMARRDVDLSAHRTQRISRDMIESADYIYCMTQGHLEAVLQEQPSAAGRAELLAGDRDIEDPIGADDGAYHSCAERIMEACRRRILELPL